MKNSFFPIATYRVQLNNQFRFDSLSYQVEYFHWLGISHFYTSPFFKAKKGSLHGYDVIDYAQLNPEIGSLQEFETLVNLLHFHKMGIIADIVPNHMYIGNNENDWWNSVLEKGLKSQYASFFDIEWHPPKRIFDSKIFLPVLDKPFGESLESQKIKLCYGNGSFFLLLQNLKLPTDPKSWSLILDPFYHEMEKLHADSEFIKNLKSILRQIDSLDFTKNLAFYFERYPVFLEQLQKQLDRFNGIKNNPSSFDSLENFLNCQHYRLCFWRIANEEINYRRFFDIFEYASIRIDNNETFQAVHKLLFEMIEKKWINGLRIDHIDGLWNPLKYLEDLREKAQSTFLYIVAEKILTGNEKLPEIWPLDGTVGYDFLNQVNGLFVNQENKQAFINIYQKFTGDTQNVNILEYECKKLVLKTLLASELNLLTIRLNSLAEKHRLFQDFPFTSLKNALLDIISCFPVYRTYSQKITGVILEEKKTVKEAFIKAQRMNPLIDKSVFDFIQNLLFFKYPDGADANYKNACNDFVMHFQQVTGPVMAKGIEDTAFYRYFPLCSINEVGGEIENFGINIENFHSKNLERFANWPHTLNATTTHDSKRSEDVRARINVLSEIPNEWSSFLEDAYEYNKKYKNLFNEKEIPSRHEEYFLYQTILGTLPFEGVDEVYIKRIRDYMQKAVKEAKINSSWLDPNQAYSDTVNNFVKNVLSDQEFLNKLQPLAQTIAECGILNSLSQLILKILSPGIPDFYQGTEIWNFSLVDPDNRNPVDYPLIREKMKNLVDLENMLKTCQDGRIKLFITQRLLQLRQKFPDLFAKGIYLPLQPEGNYNENVIAFVRKHENITVIVLTTRFFHLFTKSKLKEKFWSNTFVKLPPEITKYRFRNIFTEQELPLIDCLQLDLMFEKMPFAVLEKSEREL
jgi:(1->4)-alpha-D-glucan 1-alpha-D-glucosylmutase